MKFDIVCRIYYDMNRPKPTQNTANTTRTEQELTRTKQEQITNLYFVVSIK